jgi:hypothetical protein
VRGIHEEDKPLARLGFRQSGVEFIFFPLRWLLGVSFGRNLAYLARLHPHRL